MMLDDFLQECGGVSFKALEKYSDGELPEQPLGSLTAPVGVIPGANKGGVRVEMYLGPDLSIDAKSLPAYEKAGGWVIEPKHDGMWAMLTVGDPKNGKPHTLKSRDAKSGLVIGANAGDLPLIDLPLTPGSVIVGELEAATEQASLLHASLGFRRLHLFDFPKGGHDHRSMPWTHRRALLEGVWSAFDEKSKTRFPIVDSYPDRFLERYNEWVENGLEGCVIKRKDSLYTTPRSDGKSDFWHRCKRTLTEDYVLVGVGKTNGGQPTGHWGGYRNGMLVKVMTGRCPEKLLTAANIGTLVAEFMGWQKMASGALRHGQFVRVRTDKPAAACLV